MIPPSLGRSCSAVSGKASLCSQGDDYEADDNDRRMPIWLASCLHINRVSKELFYELRDAKRCLRGGPLGSAHPTRH